jgi:hypothetical protein
MASSFWISQAIYVAAKLGIADLLKNARSRSATLPRLLVRMFARLSD